VISHRLSITAFADLVIFLREGAVSEMGTPAELLEREGEYAELFRLQAAAMLQLPSSSGRSRRAGLASEIREVQTGMGEARR